MLTNDSHHSSLLYSLSPSWSSHKRPYEKLFKNIFLYTNWTPLISDCLGKNRLHLNSVDPLVHFLLNWFSSPTMKVLEDWTQVIPLGSKHFICWAILWPPPSLIHPPHSDEGCGWTAILLQSEFIFHPHVSWGVAEACDSIMYNVVIKKLWLRRTNLNAEFSKCFSDINLWPEQDNICKSSWHTLGARWILIIGMLSGVNVREANSYVPANSALSLAFSRWM